MVIEKQCLTESDHTQKAIDVFGTTYYRTRAGFMLKDGRMLDLTYGGNPREDHRAIQDAFDDMDLETGSDYLIEFMNEGNIRLIPEIPGIDIVKEPTEEQWKGLRDYISYMVGRSHYFMVQFSNENGQQVDWKEYEGFGTTEEILLDLHDYFENKLNEGWYDDELPWSVREPQTISELLNTDTLYHATYKPYWEEIKKSGFILPGKHSNWSDIFKTYRYIYLSTDYDNAYSYAKTAENVPKEYLNQIVVLEIDADKLDVDSLSADENQIYDSVNDEGRSIEDPLTWVELEYDKPIPISAVRKVHDEFKLNESTLAAEGQIFSLKKIGMGHYDEWLNSQSARDRDNVKIEIKELSPKEYLEACAEIFGNSFDSQKKQVQNDKDVIQELQDLIKKGVSLNATFLDYVSNPPTQEGRHRMYALAELYGWDKKYPVIIFTPANPEKAKKDQLEKQQEKLYKYIDKAVTNALDYTYRNYDELKDQISYYLENYIDNPEVKISERGHQLAIIVNGLEYEISQDEFDWDENKPDPDDDFDIEDLS